MWGYFMKIQQKEQSLGTLETTYLEEKNKVEFISEGNGKKKIRKCLRMFRCLILRNFINGSSVFESAEK